MRIGPDGEGSHAGIQQSGKIPLVVALVHCLSCSGSGDSIASVADYADAYAHAVCARAATCCTADDFETLTGGSQAACLQQVSDNLNTKAQLVQVGIQRYDQVAGAECVRRIQSASCVEVFGVADDASDPCAAVFVGASVLGEACDGDYFCQSEDCESQSCVTPPCTIGSCPAGDYCIVNTGCAAIIAEGNACTGDDMCGSAAACLGRVCSPLLDDGVACSTNRQCKSANCGLVPGATARTCRQPYCLGS